LSILIALNHIAKIVRFYEDFKFRLTVGVKQAWSTFKEYRCKMVQTDKSIELTDSDKGLYLSLIQRLFKVYRRIMNSFKTNTTITIEDKIMILR
jgi:hypothetical protein